MDSLPGHGNDGQDMVMTAGTRHHGRDKDSRPGHGNDCRDPTSRPGHGFMAGTR